jgi:hypothetical protein
MPGDLAEKIMSIDLVSLAQAEGIQLRRSGQNWQGLCPFHSEKMPSFTVKDNHFRCFGCGAHGDALDFIQQLRGFSFREACQYLGIETKRPVTKAERKEAQAKVQERKEKQGLVKRFRAWEVAYSTELGKRIRGAYKWITQNIKTPKDLDGARGDMLAGLYKELPLWEWGLEVLACGDDQEKYHLFTTVKKHGA